MTTYEQAKGALPEGMAQWENYFSQKMPLDYIKLLKSSDGAGFYSAYTGGELQFLSVKEAIQYHEIYSFIDDCPGAIPICMDGNGNFAVYRIQKGIISGIFLMPAAEIDWDSSVKVGQYILELLPIKIEDELNRKRD